MAPGDRIYHPRQRSFVLIGEMIQASLRGPLTGFLNFQGSSTDSGRGSLGMICPPNKFRFYYSTFISEIARLLL